MSKSKQSRFEKNVILTLSVITNIFIIAGVSRHWSYYDDTQLAAPQQEATQIQEETTNDTGCQSPYEIFN